MSTIEINTFYDPHTFVHQLKYEQIRQIGRKKDPSFFRWNFYLVKGNGDFTQFCLVKVNLIQYLAFRFFALVHVHRFFQAMKKERVIQGLGKSSEKIDRTVADKIRTLQREKAWREDNWNLHAKKKVKEGLSGDKLLTAHYGKGDIVIRQKTYGEASELANQFIYGAHHNACDLEAEKDEAWFQKHKVVILDESYAPELGEDSATKQLEQEGIKSCSCFVRNQLAEALKKKKIEIEVLYSLY